MSSQVVCIACQSENPVSESSLKFTCYECGQDQAIAVPCCVKATSTERFAVNLNELHTSCSLCHSDMTKLENNIYDCVKCSKYSILCVCKVINKLPPKPMSRKCSNFQCCHFTVHCDCGRITYQDLKSSDPYKCPCGYEFEYDIEIGVKRV